MKHPILILIPLLAACGGDGEGGGDDIRNRSGAEPVQTAELTGLYEGQVQGEQKARMCMVSDASGTAEFGIVTATAQGAVCSGAGEAVRQGDIIRLTMTGDEECVIDASLAGTRVTLPASVPDGCDYYCGEGATFAGEIFEKTGGTAGDAMRAADLAGDPLCA